MAQPPKPTLLHANAPALAAFACLAAPEIATFERCVPDYLLSDDPEIGHQLRVAIRRLRALLWAYRRQLPKKLANEWRHRLADVAALIGPPRNWDVIVNVLLRAAVPASEPSALILLEALEDIRQRARTESRVALDSLEPDGLMVLFSDSIAHAIDAQTESSETLSELARTGVAEASKRVAKALYRAGNGRLEALHRTRIEVKRLRYLLEFFAPVLDKRDRKRVRRLEQLQEALGDLNDVVVGAGYLAQVPAGVEYAAAYDLFARWLRKEKKVRRRAAIAALRRLAH